jgi:hypothetical protein
MALAILDGTQTATTLSTILSSGQHITAHTVVSLGTQAITDIVNATSSGLTNAQLRASAVTISGTVTASNVINGYDNYSVVTGNLVVGAGFDGAVRIVGVNPTDGSLTNLEEGGGVPICSAQNLPLPISGTVTIGAGTAQIGSVTASISGTVPISISSVTVGNSVTIGSLPSISGTVTANVFGFSNAINAPKKLLTDEDGVLYITPNAIIGISGTVTANLGSALPAGTNRIGVVTIGAGTVTIGAGTAQIGSVTASISGTVPISISSVTVGNSITIGSLPAISGTVTANTFAVQGTAVTTSNFTSTTASTVLANYNATREVLTIFNEGAGNLHICAGATCTTVAYQVRLSAGDYYEVPNHQTTITHSAVFATAGTARVTEVS